MASLARRRFIEGVLSGSAALLLPTHATAAPTTHTLATEPMNRAAWLAQLTRIVEPVLQAAADGQLQERMPIEAAHVHEADRRRVSHLEAVARTLAGIAPWLENGLQTGEEGQLRERFASLAVRALTLGVDPKTPSWLRFGEERQTIVDAGFLALALARAPHTLREALPQATRVQLANALRATRRQIPAFSNWLLFAAMVEAALFQLGEEWDRERVDYALREHSSWFVGDGTYGDGTRFHADYYNSYVIHPFLLALMDIVATQDDAWKEMARPIRARTVRYAELQERAIAPDASFAPIGRSLTYRCGAFHLLADIAQREMLPASLPPSQVRTALGAVIARTMTPSGTFDANGWLQIGLAGHQPSLGEVYISTGSLYLCTAAFLPLGLKPENPFWSAPDSPWTSQCIWSGANAAADHAHDG